MLNVDGDYEDILPKGVDTPSPTFEIEEEFLQITGDMIDNFLMKLGKNDSFTYYHIMKSSQAGQ